MADLEPLFQSAAAQYGLPLAFLKAIAQQESGANVGIRDSDQGAQGLMQLLPATAASMGARDPRDPTQAIPAAARYLREGLDKTGTLEGAAAYYHGGPDTRQWGPKTAAYVQSVGAIYGRQGGAGQAIASATRTATPATAEQALGYAPEVIPSAQKAPSMASDDFDAKWGIGTKQVPAAAAQDTAPDSFDSKWGIGGGSTAPKAPPRDAKPGPNGLMWNADGGYDPKTGALVVAGKPMTDQTAAAGSTARSGLAGFAEGLPIVGPYAQAGVERGAAAVRAITGDQKYSDALRDVQAGREQDVAAHPTANTVGQVAGAVTGYAPLAETAIGGRMLGVTGPTTLGRMGTGAVGNALLSAADATVRGDNPIIGAGLGAIGGGAAPLIGAGLSKGVQGIAGGIQNMLPTGIPGVSRSAANILTNVISADDPAAVRNKLLQLGQDAMLADAGPSTTGLTGALALKPSEAKTVVENALTGRATGSNDRIGAQLTESLGPAVDPVVASNALKAERASVNAAYKDVHANAPEVDPASVVQAIDARLEDAVGSQRAALQTLRKELVKAPQQLDEAGNVTQSEVLHSSSKRLHNLRIEVDGLLSGKAPGLGVERGAVSSKNGALAEVRNELDGVLKGQVPGMAETDASSSALADRINAVARGNSEILGQNGPFPETYAATRAAQSPEVNVAENVGIRGNVANMFGHGTQRSAVKLNKLLDGGEGGFGASNLKTAFGDEPVNALLDTLAREKAFNATTNEVVQNSATARRTAAGKLLEESAPGSLNLTNATAAGMAAQAGKRMIVDPLMKMIMESPNAPRNLEIARVLTAQGASRDQVLAQLLKLNGRQTAIGSTGNALADLMNGGANRLMLAGSGTYRPGQQ